MDYRKILAAAAFAFIAATPAALANTNADTLELFTYADTNRDGIITRAEADAFARSDSANTTIKRLDRNGDNAISRTEWRGNMATFNKLDVNRDGKLSTLDKQSQQQRIRYRYHGLDDNRDGIVTRAEWNGNLRSFRLKDINRDGFLSGTELR